jgi:hypothetical protein
VQLRETALATSDGSGNLTLQFKTTPVNQSWTGTVNIPAAPVSSSFTVMLATNPHGSWSGSSPFGPITSIGSEKIVVMGTGLAPNTQYQAILLGNAHPSNAPQASPLPTTSEVMIAGIAGAQAVSTTDNVDFLGSFATIDFGGLDVVMTFPAQNPYETIVVALTNAPTVQLAPAVRAQRQSGGAAKATTGWQTQQYRPATGTSFYDSTPEPFFLPLPVAFGDTVAIYVSDALYPATTGHSIWTGAVYGLGAPVCPYPLRPDGRMMPTGGLGASVQASSFAPTPTLIAAVPGVSVLLSQAGVGFGNTALPTAANQILLNAVVGGIGITIGWSIIQSNGIWGAPNALIPPQGLLCDADTAVTVVSNPDAVSSMFAQATYDLVL